MDAVSSNRTSCGSRDGFMFARTSCGSRDVFMNAHAVDAFDNGDDDDEWLYRRARDSASNAPRATRALINNEWSRGRRGIRTPVGVAIGGIRRSSDGRSGGAGVHRRVGNSMRGKRRARGHATRRTK